MAMRHSAAHARRPRSSTDDDHQQPSGPLANPEHTHVRQADQQSARDRDAAAPTFPPDGLYFLGPVYDAHWGLPSRTAEYDWLP